MSGALSTPSHARASISLDPSFRFHGGGPIDNLRPPSEICFFIVLVGTVVAEVPVEVGTLAVCTVAVAVPVVAIAAELDCVMPEVLDWIAVAASPAVGLSLGVIVAVAVPVGVPSELLSPPPVYALISAAT